MPTDPRHTFADLLERHRKIVFKVANMYAWTPEDRADLAQEIATQLWRAFPSCDPARPFSTWMYRVALNVAISHVRRDRRHQTTITLDEMQHDIAASSDDTDEQLRELQRVITALAPLDRALVVLYLDEHTNREIGEILGLTETNVSTRISRLKKRIREEFTLDQRISHHGPR